MEPRYIDRALGVNSINTYDDLDKIKNGAVGVEKDNALEDYKSWHSAQYSIIDNIEDLKEENFAFCDPDGSMSSALHQSISNCIETVEKRFREIEKDFEDEMTNEFRTVAKASGESLQDLVDSIPQFGV